MSLVKNVVSFNLVANVTKFLRYSLYLIVVGVLASGALLSVSPAHAQEAPAPAPAPGPVPENAKPVIPQPDGSHLVPEGVKESTPAPADKGADQNNPAPAPEGSSLPEPAPRPAMVDTSINPQPAI